MNLLKRFLNKLSILFGRRRFSAELDEEMAFHRQQVKEDFLAAGLTAEDAHHASMRQFGNTAKLKDRSHEMVGFKMETVAQDLRFALRQLRKNPGFAATAILILALGIGASVAIFAFVDAALIKPLPYPEPTRLVAVNERTELFPRNNLSYPDFADWQRDNSVFSSMDVYVANRMALNTPGETESVHGLRVSSGFFHTLGVRPALGRDFYSGEDAPGASPVVILRYGAWQNRFGGRSDVIGKVIDLGGVAHTIVGVLPRDFEFAPRNIAEFFEPLRPTDECDKRRSCHNLDGIARLRDGVTIAMAQNQMQGIAEQLEKQYPDSNRGNGASIIALSTAIVGDIKPILLVLLCGSGLLMLIACVNVSSLMLVRAESRRREIAVRGALGASRLRLSRQFLTEACTLAAAGTFVGVGAAWAGVKGLSALISKDWMQGMPFLQQIGPNPRVLLFAASLAIAAGVLFFITPLLHFQFSDMRNGLADGARGSAGRLWRRMGANLVVIELAMALVLLAGGGLLAKSLYRLLHEDLGFTTDHLVTVNAGLTQSAFSKDEQITAFEHALLDRAAALPGVESAGIEDVPPVSCNCDTDWVRFPGRPYNGIHNEVNDRVVSVGLFHTLQVRLHRGRFFTDADNANAPKVILVNQAFAEKYFPGQDAVGKLVGDTDLTPKSMRRIVGVVENFKDAGLDQPQWPAEYESFDQAPSGYFYLMLRTSQAPASLMPTLAPMMHSVSPSVTVDWQRTMQEVIDDSEPAYIHRSAAYLVGGFAVLALVLGVVGLYGVIAYSVSQRTREIGVRMALGAQRSAVYQLVLGEAGRLIAIGVVLGLGGSVGAGMLMGKLLYGVQAWDAGTLAGVAVVLAACAMLASYFPARRAASVNPTEALRSE